MKIENSVFNIYFEIFQIIYYIDILHAFFIFCIEINVLYLFAYKRKSNNYNYLSNVLKFKTLQIIQSFAINNLLFNKQNALIE